MELIVLYGPPAVGKLTIAEGLAAKTGYKIFQNNPTVQAVQPIFEFGSPEFLSTLSKIRLVLLEEAARLNVGGLIFTFCFDPHIDEEFVTGMISVVERAGGVVHLVQLIAPESVLFDRISNESRIPHNKIVTSERLQSLLERYDLFQPYSLRKSLIIDTSIFSLEQSIETILSSRDS